MQINKAKKIVIKLGSSTIVDNKGKFKKKWLLSLINDIKKLKKNKQQVVIVSSGAIALGHPIGASGTRILVTLIHEMIRRNKAKGCATLCIGGGMGIAICIEKN